MKLSGKQLTTAVLIGLMGISAGGVVMADAGGLPQLTSRVEALEEKVGDDQNGLKKDVNDIKNDYAKKTDLDAKATKDELKDYAKTADLENTYAKKTDLDGKASKDDLKEYTKTTDLENTYAKKTDLDAKATKDELKDYAKKTDLDAKATKDELKDYAKTADLANKADKSDLENKADKADLDKKADTDKVTAALGLKADKSELADYVRKSDLKISNNAKDIQKVGARAAALAGLHPLEFDPSTKLSFAVSSGSYDGENSVAFGAFYRPTKNVMLSAASTMGSKNAYTFGMSFKFGESSATTTTNTPDVQELYRVVGQLQHQVAAQQQEIQQLRQAAQKNK